MTTTLGELIDVELSKSNVDIEGLKNIVWGPKEERETLAHILDVCSKDPVIKYKPHYGNMDRAQAFENNMRRIQRIKELANEGKLPQPDMYNYGKYTAGINSLYPVSVHHGMFESIVKIMGSEEQANKYWQDIVDYRIIGCYAQTEMGTGSNVQGLETEAVYDKDTEEFVIHTPTTKAIKFWPGDLGKMANHAVLFARLIIDGESYGIHAFFIQIRDMDSHAPLPSIEIGDIGPKYGYSIKDNGYMKFDHHRIPRSAILSKYVNVSKEGIIQLNGDPRVAYATMVWIRVTLLEFNWQVLLKNADAVMRYTLMRSQFKSISNSDEERKVIDYQATQTQMVPYVAFGFANAFMGNYCRQLHTQMLENIKKDDFKLMNELHVLVSSLKAYYMQEMIDGLYTLREICGAHGYSVFADIGNWLESMSSNVTLEGDAYVLYQQTTRKLLKMVKRSQEGNSINKMVYPYIEEVFKSQGVKETDEHIEDPTKLLNVLKHALIANLEHLIKSLEADQERSYDQKWNKIYQVDISNVSKLHAVFMSAKSFKSGIKHSGLSDDTKSALQMLLKIYLCDSIFKFGDYALLSSYINGDQLMKIHEYQKQLIEDVRPHLLSLLESVNVHEGQFDTTIVARDSTGYSEQLYNFAQQSPLNRKDKLYNHESCVTPLTQKLKNYARI